MQGVADRARRTRRRPRRDPADGARGGRSLSASVRLVTDVNGRIVEASAGVVELLAIDERWLVGKPLPAFVAETDRREFRTLLLGLARGEEASGFSLQLRRRDGTFVSADVEAGPVDGSSSQHLEWIIGPTHVAEHDGSTEEEPTTAELPRAPLATVLLKIPDGIVAFDSDLKILYLNPAARLFLGLRSELRIGGSLPELWDDFSLREFGRALFSNRPPGRHVAEQPSGRLVAIEGIHARREGIAVLLVEDVTARERRRRAESEFVSNAAHELRTPLAGITSALEVLQNGAKNEPRDRDLFLGHIERESERLTKLTSALLLLASIQSGEDPPGLRLVELEPLLSDVASELQPKPGVEVEVTCPREVAALADSDLLRQALWNVAYNSSVHTLKGRIVLRGRDLGSVSELEVRDTGVGMSEAEQASVFERFYRVGHRSGNNFGLGLAIAQEAVRALSGRITLESELGVGTTVRIHLPSARLVRT